MRERYSGLIPAFTPRDTGTATAASDNGISVDDMLETIRQIKETLPPCPFEQMIKEAGMHPDNGAVLYLPIEWQYQLDDRTSFPSYVCFTPATHKPIVALSPVFMARNFIY